MNKLKWRRPGMPITREDILKVEQYFNIKFPDDYVNCTLKFHGASVTPYCIDVNKRKRVFANLLSFSDESVDNIIQIYNSSKERLKEGLFPFACDPAGNLFCFDYRKNNENPSVVFWNHELAVNELDYSPEELKRFNLSEVQEKAVEFVCNSFTNLLNMLHE